MATRLTRRIGGRPTEREAGFRLHELGAGEGPTIVVLGGVHGDESQGIRAAMKVAAATFRTDLVGRLLVVPVAHEAAFLATSRVNPSDGGNLARSFPGSPTGTPTQRLAHLLQQEVLEDADLIVDLHSSGVHYSMPELVGFPDDGAAAGAHGARAAAAMALSVTWRHPGPMPPGRTGTEAFARGVPFLYLESPEADDLSDRYLGAVLRLLVAEGMLPADDAPRATTTPRRLVGSGDLDRSSVTAPRAGLVEVCVSDLDRVEAGQRVARWTDPWFGQGTDLVADEGGVVVLARRSRGIGAGEMVVHLAQDDQPA